MKSMLCFLEGEFHSFVRSVRRDPIDRVPRVGKGGAHGDTSERWPHPSPPVGRDNAD